MERMVQEILRTVDSILVVDWPSRDVPDSLVRSGFRIVVHGGPGPEDYFEYELKNGEIVSRQIGRPPGRADLIYSHRPLSELPGIVAMAKTLQARTVWTQSGLSAAGVKDPKGCWAREEDLRTARELVESAGLNYISEPYIGDAAREIRAAA